MLPESVLVTSALASASAGGGFKRESKMNLLDMSEMEGVMSAREDEEKKIQREKDKKKEERARIEEAKREKIEARKQKIEDDKRRRSEDQRICNVFLNNSRTGIGDQKANERKEEIRVGDKVSQQQPDEQATGT
jgi:hypothetical protein